MRWVIFFNVLRYVFVLLKEGILVFSDGWPVHKSWLQIARHELC